MRSEWKRAGRAGRLLFALLALGVAGCGLLATLTPNLGTGSRRAEEPTPPVVEVDQRSVEDVRVEESGETLLISWRNPIDFDSVKIIVTDPLGRHLRAPDGRAREGPARTYLRLEEPRTGTYRVKVIARVGQSVRSAGEVPVELTQDLDDDDIGLGDPGDRDLEELDLLYLIHPRSPFAAGSSRGNARDRERATAFQYVASTVLSRTFRSAVEIRTQRDFEKIEEHREDLKRAGREDVAWLLDPAAVLVVDFRPAGPELSAQLHVRLLDLKLAGMLGLSYDHLDLYNQRALVIEGYQEIEPPEVGSLAGRLRTAWVALLGELLRHPRYREYKAAFSELALPPSEEFDRKAARYRLLFFGEVDGVSRPGHAKGFAEFVERVERIEAEHLFNFSGTARPHEEEEVVAEIETDVGSRESIRPEGPDGVAPGRRESVARGSDGDDR